jgi:16S rRNA G966 N2-methylase RsmD
VDKTFDIAFIDPPYLSGVTEDAMIKTAEKMSDYGIIVCEHPADVSVPQSACGFAVYRQYKYGKLVCVTIYKKTED